jgi:bacteriocin biosynthesis cyclodehydratase domain-containing protein
VGPTIVPWQTACYVCYTRRVASHRGHAAWDAYRASQVHGRAADEGSLPPLNGVVANQVALETARLLTGFAPPTTFARLYEFDARSPAARGHDVLRVPRCASCGRRVASRDPWDLKG